MHTDISDLPQSIIEIILTKLPIRDAVRTSVLSSKWRYKWTTLTELEFDDKCVSDNYGTTLAEIDLVKFVNQFLLLHGGPISRFTLASTYLQSSPVIDQWLLYVSRKDVKELGVELGERVWFKAPSCLFSCNKLVGLKLMRCELDPPVAFKGFPNLKRLDLQQALVTSDDVESFVSSCPLLESLTLSYIRSRKLTIRAPNLKYLKLKGEFKDIRLENTPVLEVVSVSIYNLTEDVDQLFCKSSSFDKFLGGVPTLQMLVGRSYFTKFMSIGNTLLKTHTAYRQLKVIGLHQVGFGDLKQMMALLRLILSAPNLQELRVSVSGSSSATKADLDFWDKDFAYDSLFERLKVIKMTSMWGFPHEMKFMLFLLRNSPVLEVMHISLSAYARQGKLNRLMKLQRFKRASPEAKFIFGYDSV